MNLAEESIILLEKAKESEEYHNPWLIQKIIDGVCLACPNADMLISDELCVWAVEMFSR